MDVEYPLIKDSHIWSHAWSVYRQLPVDRQSGRFKQLTKFLPSLYEPSKASKKEQKKLFYETYPQVKASTPTSSIRSESAATFVSETTESEDANLPALEELPEPEPVVEATWLVF